MKQLIYMLLLLSPIYLQAQELTEKTEKSEAITKLKTADIVSFDTKSIQFIKVIDDSRCPSNTTCFWGGQAKVLIGLYENNALIEEKEIIIGAKGISPDNPEKLFQTNKKVIYGYNLNPYPSDNNSINPADYYLELLVK